ncbi:MAG: ATP-binding protein [Planctomycetaceae bacterium]
MDSILLIREGEESSAIADCVLRREDVVVSRTNSGADAILLLNQQPFDAIVLAIDDLESDARASVELVNAEMVPKVIVTSRGSIPVQSFDINTRVVSIEDGLESVGRAIRQQLRRITKPFPVSTHEGSMEFSFKFRADPEKVSRARAIAGGFIQRCVDIDDLEFTRLELALEEALLNAVLHGSLGLTSAIMANDADQYFAQLNERLESELYRHRQVGVDIAVKKQQLSISVSDSGPGFDVTAVMTGQENGSLHAYGRGLMLMQAFADSVDFNGSGNCVTLVRNCRTKFPRAAAPAVPFESLQEVSVPERNLT